MWRATHISFSYDAGYKYNYSFLKERTSFNAKGVANKYPVLLIRRRTKPIIDDFGDALWS